MSIQVARSDEDRWPAVDAAFSFVLPSYQFILSRFEAADTRLTTILATLSAVAIGAPTIVKGMIPQASMVSVFFLIGEAVFLIAMWNGILHRTRGIVVLPDPMRIHQKSLTLSPHEFKVEQLFFAGQHFDSNVKEIARKGTVANWLTIALVAEVVSFIAWVIAA